MPSQRKFQNMFSRLARTTLLKSPTSPRLNGWRTQLVSDIKSPSISFTSRPTSPLARMAWCRYGKPHAKALPVPPQPITSTLSGPRVRQRSSSSGSMTCSMAMGNELLQGLIGGLQIVLRERARLARQFRPQTCRTAGVRADSIPDGVSEI